MRTFWLFEHKAKIAAFLVLVSVFTLGDFAYAAKTVDERLEELEKEMALLKRQKEIDKEITIKRDIETPVVVAGKDGFNVRSKDQAFQLKFRAQIQTDFRNYINDDTSGGSNTFIPRRVRPILEGTLYKYIDFRLMPDFGGGTTVLQDAWVDFKYWKPAQLRIGKFKSPIGLERLQSDPAAQFIETALSTNLVPNRDLGIDLHGDFFDSAITYDAGVFNGVADNASADADIHDDKEFAGRLFTQAFKNTTHDELNGLGIGIGASAGQAHGATLPTLRSGGQQTIFGYTPAAGTVLAQGARYRFAPQAYYYFGPFGALSEFVLSSEKVTKGASTAKIDNKGYQIALNWVLTGENASYTGVVPRNSFDPANKTWGAFELVGRFSALGLDADVYPTFSNPLTSVRDAKAWTLGLNWYLNKSIKFMTNFEETFFNGGLASGAGDRKTEHALLSRVQLFF